MYLFVHWYLHYTHKPSQEHSINKYSINNYLVSFQIVSRSSWKTYFNCVTFAIHMRFVRWSSVSFAKRAHESTGGWGRLRSKAEADTKNGAHRHALSGSTFEPGERKVLLMQPHDREIAMSRGNGEDPAPPTRHELLLRLAFRAVLSVCEIVSTAPIVRFVSIDNWGVEEVNDV